MSIVSAIPGRLRLESRDLVNKLFLCRLINNKIKETNGVISIEVNHRTGRVLIEFDELIVSSKELFEMVRAIVEKSNGVADLSLLPIHISPNGKGINNTLIHAVIDIAVHVVMPKPLGVLLPIAINAMRKNL
jgi:copper chaperone CopZ